MRIIESLLILLVLIFFTSTVNILLIDYEVEYENSLITYNKILAYQILNSENIVEISEKLSEYPNIIYICVNGSKAILETNEPLVVTVRGFILGEKGTLKPSWVIIGVRP